MLLDLKTLNPAQRQQWLQHAVAPRPIAFVSTIDKAGNVNLSPFSFFNLFSSNPPIVVFSPARRVRDNTTKHTLENLLEVPEVVINIADENLVHQISLSSCDYPKEVNEFIKAGLTEEKASFVRPPMVKESKIKLECKVIEVKPLGTEGGAGNLVICEVLYMHVDETVLNNEKTMVDQRKIHHVARLGGDWYCRVNEASLFEVEKPNIKLGIGIDNLPKSIRESSVLTGNNLAQLANVHAYPAVDPGFTNERLKNIVQYFSLQQDELEKELHKYAQELLNDDKVNEAWQILLFGDVQHP
ncbi:MAG: flavin reductase family protein [Bacteroidota bacterium]|jgi:flavin reductase (DIM6/NTAB) family NADH-FMN oxidoreductase RutF